MLEKKKVFISYKRNIDPDDRIAQEVFRRLSEKNDVFIDRSMRVGIDWGKEIEQHIKNADFFISLISRQSVESDMVRGEIETAYRLNKNTSRPFIFPIRLNFTDPLTYPLSAYLNSRNYFLWKNDFDTEELVMELETEICGQDLQNRDHFKTTKSNLLERHLKDLLKLGEYDKVLHVCGEGITYDPDNALLYIMFAISKLRGKVIEKQSQNTIKTVEAHLCKALKNSNYRYTALVILGIIKYEYYVLKSLLEDRPLLEEIIAMIREEQSFSLDKELIEFVSGNMYTLKELGIELSK